MSTGRLARPQTWISTAAIFCNLNGCQNPLAKSSFDVHLRKIYVAFRVNLSTSFEVMTFPSLSEHPYYVVRYKSESHRCSKRLPPGQSHPTACPPPALCALSRLRHPPSTLSTRPRQVFIICPRRTCYTKLTLCQS